MAAWYSIATLCSCGHAEIAHILKDHPDYRVRALTRCTNHSGAGGQPCVCAGFDPVEGVWERREVCRLPFGQIPETAR